MFVSTTLVNTYPKKHLYPKINRLYLRALTLKTRHTIRVHVKKKSKNFFDGLTKGLSTVIKCKSDRQNYSLGQRNIGVVVNHKDDNIKNKIHKTIRTQSNTRTNRKGIIDHYSLSEVVHSIFSCTFEQQLRRIL